IDALIRERKACVFSDSLPQVIANRQQLSQVLQNLLSNAIQHCDEAPIIRIDAHEESGFWRIRVTDNGTGIDEANRERIFEPFKRLTRKREGLGLGLAICRKIMESHGGTIACESSSREGTVFSFRLPKPASAMPAGLASSGASLNHDPATAN